VITPRGPAPLIVLAAGGTAGHLFPAEALACALTQRGIAVDLATDVRVARYRQSFPARQIHIIPSETLRGRNPLRLAATAARLGVGFIKAWLALRRLRPAAVIGFGGYPTIPTVLAARLHNIPTIIHEQNGVMGRANRLLARYVSAIAMSFPGVVAPKAAPAARITLTGNPVRPAVIADGRHPYPHLDRLGPLRLLVFGGSQGARIMADVVPAAVARLDPGLRTRLSIVQQARAEDLGRVRERYASLAVTAEVASFFPDLPRRMADAHLVIARAGASTVAELAVIGRPAILVPLPHALDQDQLANATVLMQAGGAIVVKEDAFSPARLAEEVTALAQDPERAVKMAAAARAIGTVNAAERLADLALAVAGIAGSQA
jgi:UDP-N-acetylglucosamine--N-acetylmuramyl-(pentapeptide) pyrophosphoryl-undecaprenol N-acetylglucosamine transferase